MHQNEILTKEGNVTWHGVIGRIGFSVAMAVGLYALVTAYLVTPYINKASDAGRVIGVFEGYQRIAKSVEPGRELVLFWGSSMVREGVDCDLLESALPRLSAYNLSVSGDIPYRRIVELPPVRKLRPDRVVIGVSYPEVFENRAPFEDQIAMLPAKAYREMPESAQALMDSRFRRIANRTSWERWWWKRKFLFSAVCWKLGVKDRSNPLPPGYVDNLKKPHVYTKNIPYGTLDRFLSERKGYYPPYTAGETSAANSVSGRSLSLLVRELEKQGSEVLLVNMPLHPLLNERVPGERRIALTRYLNGLASRQVQVVDYQNSLGAEDFTDLVHLNAGGRTRFTKIVAGLLTHRQTISTAAVK